MAATLKYHDALNIVQALSPRIVESSAAASVCNLVTNEIWNKFDWRESIATLPPFYLIPNEQDYGDPQNAVPSDFLGLRQVYVQHYGSTPVPPSHPLIVIQSLDLTAMRGLPTSISYQKDREAFRVHPRTPENLGCPNYVVTGTYKKRPTLITPATTTSVTLPFDDLYLKVWIEGFKWALWTIGGDQRAGGIQVGAGQFGYSGQMAVFHEAINAMASNEGLNLGDDQIAPREGLVSGSGGFPADARWVIG